jgi:6-phosphogluconolactonase (cycloisomerase 2 family)
MRTRFTWFVAILALVAIGFLVACSSKYSTSSNGLVVVPSYASLVMESFSLNLGNGHISEINNINGPPIPGVPTAVVLDPAGAFAYVIIYQNTSVPGSITGIASFQIASDGKLAYLSTAPVATPVGLTIDSAGKYLFVTSGTAGTVTVLSVGSNATLNEVATVSLPLVSGGQTPSASALAVTPTVYPPLYAYCSSATAPTTENLYVTDSVNYLLFNYLVDTSTGALTPVPVANNVPGIATGTTPLGVAVDPCNRFVFVSNNTSNSVSAYTVCSAISIPNNCPVVDFHLTVVAGSPFAVSPGDHPGPLAVDPYGKFLYVLDGSNEVSAFTISSVSGSLATIGAYATGGLGSNSIAIRSDDTWVFVANFTSSTVTQYAITPSSGGLTPQPPFSTLSNPTGVAVK